MSSDLRTLVEQEVELTHSELEDCFKQTHRILQTEYSRFAPGWVEYGHQVNKAVMSKVRAIIAAHEAKQATAPAVPQGWTDADSDSARLALELECLLMDTKDLSVVSKWWASANEALELHLQRLYATPAPAPAPAQERCSTCGYLTSEREHLGCLRRAVKDLDIATGGPYDAQEVGTTTDAIHAGLWRHAVRKGVVTVHTECMDDRNPGTKCSWIQGHDKAADVSNEAAALRAKGQS